MRYAAFFRGINVGGKNKVKMAGLRELFTGLGCENVKSYIQSGNVLFDSRLDEAALVVAIGDAFAERFGFASEAILRTKQQMQSIIEGMPFTQQQLDGAAAADPQVEHLYVYLANEDIPAEEAEKLALYDGPDRFYAAGRDLYLLCQGSVRNSRLAAQIARIGLPLTSRNMKTIRKVYALQAPDAVSGG